MKHNQLRIITLNTWKGDGRYQRRLERMAQSLKQLQPDILCLQESLRTEDLRLDTAGCLGRELGLEVLFWPGRRKNRIIEGEEHDCYSGLAILSPQRAIEQQLLPLPNCSGDLDRTALSALFDWNGLPLVITNTHLTHISGKDTLREKQLQAAMTSAWDLFSRRQSESSHTEKPWFLCCGDMNFEIHSALMKRLAGERGTSVHDCYVQGGGVLPGFTAGLDGKCPCRLDYILCLQGEMYRSIHCRNAQLVLAKRGRSGGGVAPSDHFGVMVDIF